MLTAAGFDMVARFLARIMTERPRARVALALIPIAFGPPGARVASTCLFVRLVGVDDGDTRRASILRVAVRVLAMPGGAFLFGVIPLAGTP